MDVLVMIMHYVVLKDTVRHLVKVMFMKKMVLIIQIYVAHIQTKFIAQMRMMVVLTRVYLIIIRAMHIFGVLMNVRQKNKRAFHKYHIGPQH